MYFRGVIWPMFLQATVLSNSRQSGGVEMNVKGKGIAATVCIQSYVTPTSCQPLSSPHIMKWRRVFKLIVLLPLVIWVIITTGLGFPHAASVPQNVHFKPLRSSGSLNLWTTEQRFIYRPTAHVVNFADILMRKGESQLGEKLDFQQEVYDLFCV